MSKESKSNFMRASALYLKMTEQQRNAFDNKQILSLILSEKYSGIRNENDGYQNQTR